ncbi:MAG: bifunctional oligoribonuclease/PAP phosphatase NrnA [Treponema sp.]|jgi:phosphoesterase RecJ-like protein|nr:bifunctional oligoribonuclease/PAP phosphatase NrnA [Treponema sp.]
MFEDVLSFIEKNKSFILTTHDPPDPDGVGAQLVFASILKRREKEFKIINSTEAADIFHFMDQSSIIESWDAEKHLDYAKRSALLIIDTPDEYHIGTMRNILKTVNEVFIFDHHEPRPLNRLPGFIDPKASSVSELTIELACRSGIDLESETATAAYAGIVYDSGFFAYPKTSIRTFKAAIKTLEWGADPNYIYRQLKENSSCAAILLQKQALSTLEFYSGKKIAVMFLLKEDMEQSGAGYEDAEGIVNIPLRAKEVEVSVLFKEKADGEINCSLRSKGNINVSKIAQNFGGGGHISAAGFRSEFGLKEALEKLLKSLEERLAM